MNHYEYELFLCNARSVRVNESTVARINMMTRFEYPLCFSHSLDPRHNCSVTKINHSGFAALQYDAFPRLSEVKCCKLSSAIPPSVRRLTMTKGILQKHDGLEYLSCSFFALIASFGGKIVKHQLRIGDWYPSLKYLKVKGCTLPIYWEGIEKIGSDIAGHVDKNTIIYFGGLSGEFAGMQQGNIIPKMITSSCQSLLLSACISCGDEEVVVETKRAKKNDGDFLPSITMVRRFEYIIDYSSVASTSIRCITVRKPSYGEATLKMPRDCTGLRSCRTINNDQIIVDHPEGVLCPYSGKLYPLLDI